jgi:hypothetical protein
MGKGLCVKKDVIFKENDEMAFGNLLIVILK